MYFRRKNGSGFWVLASTVGLIGPDGEYAGSLGFLVDITERKRAQIARYFLVAVVESSQDSVVTVDAQSVITSWNDSAERFYGYSATEAIGQPPTMLALPEDLKLVLGNAS